MKTDLHKGDKIRAQSWSNLKEWAALLVRNGYEVEVKGWEDMQTNTLTITKAPRLTVTITDTKEATP